MLIPGLIKAISITTIIGAVLTLTWPLYKSLKAPKLYVLGIINYPMNMLRHRIRKGKSIITETYQPRLT